KNIQANDTKTGKLAVGAYDEYRFKGFANTPILITNYKSNSNLRYNIEIYNSQEIRSFYETGFGGEVYERGFTPKTDGEYTLKITATSWFGSYKLKMM
ncbi:MAG: hypothetical protein GY737_11725, partial [Desulfobacteraceae bacterium]|nr:hypothetical protein [Desulfobacteraceae bacterium]